MKTPEVMDAIVLLVLAIMAINAIAGGNWLVGIIGILLFAIIAGVYKGRIIDDNHSR